MKGVEHKGGPKSAVIRVWGSEAFDSSFNTLRYKG